MVDGILDQVIVEEENINKTVKNTLNNVLIKVTEEEATSEIKKQVNNLNEKMNEMKNASKTTTEETNKKLEKLSSTVSHLSEQNTQFKKDIKNIKKENYEKRKELKKQNKQLEKDVKNIKEENQKRMDELQKQNEQLGNDVRIIKEESLKKIKALEELVAAQLELEAEVAEAKKSATKTVAFETSIAEKEKRFKEQRQITFENLFGQIATQVGPPCKKAKLEKDELKIEPKVSKSLFSSSSSLSPSPPLSPQPGSSKKNSSPSPPPSPCPSKKGTSLKEEAIELACRYKKFEKSPAFQYCRTNGNKIFNKSFLDMVFIEKKMGEINSKTHTAFLTKWKNNKQMLQETLDTLQRK
uniref:Uncharacterized protein n=1 Tax=Panagrolaimus davidi TaxID=227884 RepID=A0A914PA30_9BILA